MNQNIKSNNRLPELLAPAGSLESFHAGIEAGANAVYLGLDVLNARIRAKNFTIKTLSHIIPFAHSKNVKVYVALNTLVKQNEIRTVIDVLYQLEQLSVDAIIVQDIGLVYITKKFFPKIEIHASTQMTIHNSIGVQYAKEAGITRAILSRELTMNQIKSISQKSQIELEVFVHGALCYSVSGLCLASSYLGGASGNRGMCTQVCRRKFDAERKSGFYFSPKDFCAVEFIPEYIQSGISSIKIEGRMRSAEYVFEVVSRYRTALDNIEKIPDVKEQLNYDLGRDKTTFLLKDNSYSNIIVPYRPSGTGIFLGKVLSSKQNQILVETTKQLQVGDRIRIHNKNGQEGIASKIVGVELNTKNSIKILLKNNISVTPGGSVFLVSKKESNSFKWNKKQIKGFSVKLSEKCPFAHKILKQTKKTFFKSNYQNSKERLYIRIDNIEWLYHLGGAPFNTAILDVGIDGLRRFCKNKKLRKVWSSRVIVCIPPFISENDIENWNKLISELSNISVNKWMTGHVSQIKMLPKSDTVFADNVVWCINKFSWQTLYDLGYKYFSYSLEDDFLNVTEIAGAGSNGLFTLFGHINIFQSKVPSALSDGTLLTDSKKYQFFTANKNDLSITVGQKPLCLFSRKSALSKLGIFDWVIDVSYINPDKRILRKILQFYKQNKKIPDTTFFNHKTLLK